MKFFKLAVSVAMFLAMAVFATVGAHDVSAQTIVTTNQEVGPQAAKPKGAVDLLLDDLKKLNEPVLRRCIENCPESQEPTGTQIRGGEPVDKVLPVYPAIARAAHAEGNVAVLVMIDEDGKVIAAQSVSGHPLLQAAAVSAARQSTFTPTLADGKPVKVLATLTYSFVID